MTLVLYIIWLISKCFEKIYPRKLYDTAGQCLSCGLLRCEETQTKFHDFAKSALMVHKGQLTCSKSGQPLKSQKPGRENTAFSVSGEEESLR